MDSIESLNKQREKLVAQLVVLNNELATKKSIGGRRKTKKAINSVERQIKDIDKQIKSLNRIDDRGERKQTHAEADLALAEQGIDRRGNMTASISGAVSSVGQSAFGQFGIFGQKGVFSEGRASVERQKGLNEEGNPEGGDEGENENKLMMYGIIGLAVMFVLMMFKK